MNTDNSIFLICINKIFMVFFVFCSVGCSAPFSNKMADNIELYGLAPQDVEYIEIQGSEGYLYGSIINGNSFSYSTRDPKTVAQLCSRLWNLFEQSKKTGWEYYTTGASKIRLHRFGGRDIIYIEIYETDVLIVTKLGMKIRDEDKSWRFCPGINDFIVDVLKRRP